MGSDASPQILFDAAVEASRELEPPNKVVVIGTHSVIRQLRESIHSGVASIEFHAVADAICMSDEPLQAVCHKTGSSMVVGLRLLRKQYLDAFVSAGNTGALIAGATLQLPKLPGIKRPALLANIPTIVGSVAVLDVGGNVACKPQNLVQYALMGAAYQSCSKGIAQPSVGLLNIGVEPKKGTSAVREAYQILQQLDQTEQHALHFLGNIEGREVFLGGVDVLVTDGFTGNVFLKTSEGVSSFIFEYITSSLNANQQQLQSILTDLKKYVSYTEYPGAFICGVERIVIKCHGHATKASIHNSILEAKRLIEQKLIERLRQTIELTYNLN